MKPVMKMSFSEKLAQAMKDKDMSTRRLSELTGIPKSAIQRYTSGETEKIPIDRMIRMTEAMGIDPAYVMGWARDSTEEISSALGSNSPAALKLRGLGDQLALSPLLKETAKALGSSPELKEMNRAMLRMSPEERRKMVEMGKVLFPNRFTDND